MWYTYVLRSLKNGRNYIGYTNDLKRRFSEHNSDKFTGTYTYNNAPFKLIYYEAYVSKFDAQESEKFFKTGYGREVLKGKLKNFLQLNK